MMIEWTDQDTRDAARLLQRLEQRSKNRLAGGQNCPAEIQEIPGASPCVPGEKRLAASNNVGEIAQAASRSAISLGEAEDRTTDVGRSGSGLEFDGRPELQTLDFVQSFSSTKTGRPSPGDFRGEERARERHAPEDGK